MTKRVKKIAWVCLTIPVFFAFSLFLIWSFNLFHSHEHCIKVSGSGLSKYASEHEGQFPFHTNGFGDALLLLIKEDAFQNGDTNTGEHSLRYITGPGDDGEIFRAALRTGGPVAEEKCSRIYVQGLKETSNSQIAILFDKKAVRGGDHLRRPWGRPLREVCMLDGVMETVPEEKWPAFSKRQIELLVEEGFERSAAERYYQIP